jgi:transposase
MARGVPRGELVVDLRVQPPPLLPHEAVYIGIDVGKQRHVAGFVSTTLLNWHRRFEGCPVLLFDNSREGFRSLTDRIRTYAPLEQVFCLVEKTGHYHKALVDYLLELDVSVYVMHVHKRPRGLLKTDKRDALNLANHLYNQLEKGVQFPDRTQLARRALPPSETAAQLKGLMGHRYELVHESTQRKNKLTAICDQLCPEFTQVFKDPNSAAGLAVREQYPTAYALATADLDELCAAKGIHRNRPGRAELARLQDLAAHSIGVHDPHRLDVLVFEQQQLIRELHLIQDHLDAIDTRVAHSLEHSREGRIVRSIPGVGVYASAAILAAIGNIDNFPNAAALKAYFGWAPQVRQSGESIDTVTLSRAGERAIKPIMYLVAMYAIRGDTEWAALYHRLVERKCTFDDRTDTYRGRKKVIGRIAGQMTGMIYGLLRADAELQARTPAGTPLPEPRLYDPTIHHAHRAGAYRSMKPRDRPVRIVQLSEH